MLDALDGGARGGPAGRLATRDVPVVAYGTDTLGAVVGPRLGCGVWNGSTQELDLAALRRARRRPGMGTLLARNRFELYADTYAATKVHEANTLDSVDKPERSTLLEAHRRVITRLTEEGLI